MAYCVLDDVKNQIPESKIIELTDDEGTGTINEVRVTEAIAKADALIDSYCGQVETVPFTTVPPIIKQHSVTITIYNLYTRRAVAPELVRKNYEDALKHLRDIADGKASLPPVAEGEVPGGDEAQISSGERIFTRDKMKGF